MPTTGRSLWRIGQSWSKGIGGIHPSSRDASVCGRPEMRPVGRLTIREGRQRDSDS